MRYYITTIAIILTTWCFSQNTIPKVLEKFNNKSVPYISVELLQSKENIVLLDAREIKEFNVSHIENAINVGFDKFNSKKVTSILKDKKDTIVVYCSIGVRSEKIGEKLLKLGYKNVFNLYGGIFEWKNKGGKVVTNQNIKTDKIHTFNKEWSVYLKKGTKVYED
ncbi:rhodanese-like domain-containing protein [Flavobacterium cellulosilyticum]|uniref:Rhodanese-like domain-containing protein n=1 Tax=Flavobacterium cellulosilyticum TaxID=2541731 RepID=A0A4V2YZ32_9FLAO|nr:rhodanese-like domain-containing protein [Flavobacterium cellulosilyticum]TDD95547.1 rhodanese-like domain-containing protein [Flavobacterium cellulosilyticum]